MTTTNQRQAGARAAGGEAPGRKKFPWWLLLLALLALGLLFWLLGRGGDDASNADGQAEDATSQNAGVEGDAGAGADAAGDAGGAGAAGDAAGGAAGQGKGQITAGNATVYPAAGGVAINTLTGDKAVAKSVTVESVVSDEGFWAGDANDRVFVRLRTGGDESGPQIKAGDRVDFTGSVKQHDASFAQKLGVEGNEGAEELTSQGAHIEVPEVAISDK